MLADPRRQRARSSSTRVCDCVAKLALLGAAADVAARNLALDGRSAGAATTLTALSFVAALGTTASFGDAALATFRAAALLGVDAAAAAGAAARDTRCSQDRRK